MAEKIQNAKGDTVATIPGDEPKPVHVAWSDVMNDILGLGKNQTHDSPGAKFKFRGIDDLMNVCGPVFRKHVVMVIPSVRSASYRDVTTSGGKPSRETTVQVQYQIIGPAGDVILGISAGEAMDNGDKGTAKAMSVAFRVFLLQALCLPTDEPDPDSEAYQRAGGKTPQQAAQETADKTPTATTAAQLMGVKRWAADRNLLDMVVTDGDGNARPLITILDEKIAELDPEAGARAAAAEAERAGNVAGSLGGGS